jgi:4-carboxymuconolactone decarboxylase
MIDAMRANAPENQKFIQYYLSAYCFGDTYTRNGLDLKTRELLTFVCIICLGGCDSQAKSHVMGNLVIGNTPDVLIASVAQCLPYIGFPRTLNAMTAINETLKMQEQVKQNQ